MAYLGGYASGYADTTDGSFTFSPTIAGADAPMVDYNIPEKKRDMLWRHYDLPTQIHILYTSGVSSTKSSPTPDDFAAADVGSGNGDRMVWRSPGGPYPVTAAEAQTIIDDATYADLVD